MVAQQRILVVDDEPLVVKSCRRILGAAGYQVETAGTGKEGLDLALRERYDLVMADLRLPDVDGMDLVRAIRDGKPDLAVIIITGYGSVPSAVQAVKLGVRDYIEKPFTPEQITDAVGVALTGSGGGAASQIEAAAVHRVLRQAAGDGEFSRRLLAEGSRVLSGLALGAPAKGAIVSGDVAWIEKEFGELTPLERQWLQRRLEAEVW